MKAGIFQCACEGLSPSRRLQKLEKMLQQQELDLLVCPELFMSGYAVGERLLELAESVNGEFSQRIAELAQRYQTAIVYGYPERADDQLFNSAACIGRDGKLLANHRKLMLPPGFEADYFCAGDKATLFDLAGLRCALLVCYDVEFPELVRTMAAAGAQVIIVPTALAEQWGVVANSVIPSRAFENGVWLVYANHAGMEADIRYLGESCIVAPDGQDVVRAGAEECLISAILDAGRVTACQQRLPYLQEYQRLNHGSW